jgi:hypothetical protein
MRVLQLFSSPFERSVERGECGLMHRIHRVGQGLTGLPVAPDHDLHDPHCGDQRHDSQFHEPSRLRNLRVIRLHGGRFQGSEHLLNGPPQAIPTNDLLRLIHGRNVMRG